MKWEEVQRRYHELTREPGWWWKERSHIGHIAAAAWLANGASLEEYRHTKKGPSGPYTGRADLYIQLGARSYAVEAKHRYLSVRTRTEKFVSVAQAACSDKAKTYDWSDQFIGAGFIGVYKKSKDSDSAREAVQRQVESLKVRDWSALESVAPAGLLSFYFPTWVDAGSTRSDQCFHPGAVTILAFK